MPCIVIAYKTVDVENKTVRIYDDSTEKYFEDPEDQSTKNYIEYLSNKGYTIDTSEVKLYAPGEFDINPMVYEDAIAKLTEQEKHVLGINNG